MVRLAVIGVGKLGAIHARLAAATKGAELVGVHDVDADRAEELARSHRVRPFASLDDAIDRSDACIVVTPTSTHADIAEQVMRGGNDVFIEKPVTSTVEEADRLVEVARSTGRIVSVGHVERFNPAFLAAADAPPPLFVEAHRLARFSIRATDVAVVFDLMIHDIDLVLALMNGEEPTEIRASGVAVASDEIDIANARLEFASGCTANLTASRISRSPMRKMRLFSRDSYTSLDFGGPTLESFRIARPDTRDADSTPHDLSDLDASHRVEAADVAYARPQLPEINPIGRELELFAASVAERTEAPVTLEEGRRAVVVAEEIVRRIAERNLDASQ